MRDNPPVTDLVTRARTGNRQAWDALAERYAPLVWSICRKHGLSDTGASDVGELVWLQLAGQPFRAISRPVGQTVGVSVGRPVWRTPWPPRSVAAMAGRASPRARGGDQRLDPHRREVPDA